MNLYCIEFKKDAIIEFRKKALPPIPPFYVKAESQEQAIEIAGHILNAVANATIELAASFVSLDQEQELLANLRASQKDSP